MTSLYHAAGWTAGEYLKLNQRSVECIANLAVFKPVPVGQKVTPFRI